MINWTIAPTDTSLGDWNKDSTIDRYDWESIIYNARSGNGNGIFLSSAGEDMEFNYLMGESVNEDNINNEMQD